MGKIVALIDKLQDILFPILLGILCFIIYIPAFDNDTYWIINIGRYIVNNGFPNIDPFTIHEGLSVTIQQWLSDVIFFATYNAFGQVGIYFVMVLTFFVNCLVLYRICVNVSQGNKTIAKIVTVIACISINLLIKARPQIFSQLIFLIEIYMLEKYIANKKLRYLLWLIFLSFLLINLHAAIWPLYFILFGPYILDGFKTKNITKGYGTMPLIVTFMLSIVIGIVNPYGIKNMLYFFNSYGIDIINSTIVEMQSPDFKSVLGIFVFILMLLCIIVLKMKGKFCLRHLLLVTGTLFLGLSSVRSLFFFFICAAIYVSYHLMENHKLDEAFSDYRKIIINYIAIFIVLISAFIIKQNPVFVSEVDYEPQGAVDYIKQNLDLNTIRIFNDFESGGFIEYNGIKTFIDSRCEVFFKKINNKEDIFNDYVNFGCGKLHYKDLVKKYGITHFLVKKDDKISIYLTNDNKYKTIYSDEKFIIIEVGKE